jgi:uncharacterized protein (TIGR00299 family) protein
LPPSHRGAEAATPPPAGEIRQTMTEKVLHVHLDAVGGAAGDMFVAALLDACPYLVPRVEADLAAVLPPGAGRPDLSSGTSCGIAVRRFRLVAPDDPPPTPVAHDHPHDHAHTHAHGHDHTHGHDHSHPHGHTHPPAVAAGAAPAAPVHYGELVALIRAAALSPGTAATAIAILHRLAEAEAGVHGLPIEAVHFHEIADWDSLMDVVAAGSIVAALDGATWTVSDLPRGGGRVATRHGLMPVPAPATTRLLIGFRLCEDRVGGERVTPTGAAILAHLVDPDRAPPTGERLVATGLGAGMRELPGLPNVLRALVWSAAPTREPAGGTDRVVVLGFDVDDMTGEEIGIAGDRLRAAEGVLDLSLSQRIGKKSRPLTEFRLLVVPARCEAIVDLCFLETSTIGVRRHGEERRVLPRQADGVDGPVGRLRRKRVERPGAGVTIKVESDDLVGIAGLDARRRAGRHAEEQR